MIKFMVKKGCTLVCAWLPPVVLTASLAKSTILAVPELYNASPSRLLASAVVFVGPWFTAPCVVVARAV